MVVSKRKQAGNNGRTKHKGSRRKELVYIPTLQELADGMLLQYECIRQMADDSIAEEILSLLLLDLEKEKEDSELAKGLEQIKKGQH